MSLLSTRSRASLNPYLNVFGVVLLAAVLAGCAAGSTPGTSTLSTAAAGSTSSAQASTSQSPATPAASQGTSPAAGGGATDFCSAFKEYRAAVQKDTPEAQGAGYRAAATDLRTYAPADIKPAAGLLADVVDEVGQSILAGHAAPEILTQGQSPERIQAAFDVSKWIDKNCA